MRAVAWADKYGAEHLTLNHVSASELRALLSATEETSDGPRPTREGHHPKGAPAPLRDALS